MAKRKVTREIWRAIPGFEGYEASSLGRIRSVDRVVIKGSRWGELKPRRYRGKILALFKNGSPYIRVTPGYDHSPQYVHRLVALAFHGKSRKKEVSHLDGNPRNNKPSNLAWMTRSENNFLKAAHRPFRTRCKICGLKCLIGWRDDDNQTRYLRSPEFRGSGHKGIRKSTR